MHTINPVHFGEENFFKGVEHPINGASEALFETQKRARRNRKNWRREIGEGLATNERAIGDEQRCARALLGGAVGELPALTG